MKFVLSIKHCHSIGLEQICEPCENFDNYCMTNGCFWVMTISMWYINILTNYHFQAVDDKICEVGHF